MPERYQPDHLAWKVVDAVDRLTEQVNLLLQQGDPKRHVQSVRWHRCPVTSMASGQCIFWAGHSGDHTMEESNA